MRMKRHWWALCFRLRLPQGQKGTVLKVAGLAVMTYVFLFANWVPWSSTTASSHFAVEQLLSGGEGTSLFRKKKAALPVNEAAPVSKRQLTREMAEAYIAQYSALARSEMQKYGVPASISLAQGLVESRAGDSKLARNNNNHFGIKCFSRRCKKGHCSNFTDDTHKDFFRKFNQPADSWRVHSIMISTGRYAWLKKHGRDYRKWACGLKSTGYATDATYAEKLIGMIEEYDLQRFDR
jgi:flagellum-specific peptidoglycan hydrolase FlgJ